MWIVVSKYYFILIINSFVRYMACNGSQVKLVQIRSWFVSLLCLAYLVSTLSCNSLILLYLRQI